MSDNVISLNGFVAKKEQQKNDKEKEEWDQLYRFIGEVINNNPSPPEPFFAYSSEDVEASNMDTVVLKLMDAITLLDNLGKKKEAHIINRVVADLLGIETV
jgi:hypothetical protein